MTSIPVLLTTGHSLFHARLMKAHAAVDEGDWADAKACLAEFARRFEAHMRAEETVRFPRLVGRGTDVDARLARCRNKHEGLRLDIRATAAAAEVLDRVGFDTRLAHLIDTLYRHCEAEQRTLYPLTNTMDEDDLGVVAQALSASGDDGGAPGTIGPADPRQH